MKNNLNIFSNLKAELLGVVFLSMLMTSCCCGDDNQDETQTEYSSYDEIKRYTEDWLRARDEERQRIAIQQQKQIQQQKEAELRIINEKKEAELRIITAKKDGTLGQYLTDTKGCIRDTATVVSVYKERRGVLNGNADYTSASHGSNGGGGLMLGGIGIGAGGGSSSSSAQGNANLSGRDGMIQSVVAKDKYGYTYTFEIAPEMDCHIGDKLDVTYYGRIASANRFFDKVLINNIIYKER